MIVIINLGLINHKNRIKASVCIHHIVLATVHVTDKEMRVCMDPEGNGATMNEGGDRGPGLPGRG
jgi:hypothetical protein